MHWTCTWWHSSSAPPSIQARPSTSPCTRYGMPVHIQSHILQNILSSTPVWTQCGKLHVVHPSIAQSIQSCILHCTRRDIADRAQCDTFDDLSSRTALDTPSCTACCIQC